MFIKKSVYSIDIAAAQVIIVALLISRIKSFWNPNLK